MTAINGHDIKNIFSFFFKSGMRTKRTRAFFIFSLIPTLIFIIVNFVIFLNPNVDSPPFNLFSRLGGSFFFQLFIPILALFFGSSVISDEVEDKTLIYLTTSPVSRFSLMTGKFLAYAASCVIIVGSGILLAYLTSNFTHMLEPGYIKHLGIYFGCAVLACLAYTGLFNLVGTLMKRSILVGFLFFGWELVVQFFPGSTQKLTISHYIKSMLPIKLSTQNSLLTLQLEPTGAVQSILTLLIVTAVFLGLAALVFYKKEYTLSDQA